MIDPASRNAAWRFGFDTPVQVTDNELNCGGFSKQWDTNKGKCGVCGDAYNEKPKYTHPGKYATGTITKTYREGQEITVRINVTSNHQGYFNFSVGRIGTPPITQEKLKYMLKQWFIDSNRNKGFDIKMKLPAGLTCDHCVLQWWWKVANSWGCDVPGDFKTCGMGKGAQETFVNCADIRITKSDGSVPPDPPTQAPPPTTQAPTDVPTQPPTPPPTNAPNPGGCKAIGPWAGNPGYDNWCVQNCALGNCPTSLCQCG